MTFEEWWEEPIPDSHITKEQARRSIQIAMERVWDDALDFKVALQDAFDAGYKSGVDDVFGHEYEG